MKLTPRDAKPYFARPDPARTGLLIYGGDAMRVALKRQQVIAALIGAAALVYIGGAFIPTASVNVPMNIALEAYSAPLPLEEAQALWAEYSPRWQFWNTLRTIASGITLLLVGTALYRMPRAN